MTRRCYSCRIVFALLLAAFAGCSDTSTPEGADGTGTEPQSEKEENSPYTRYKGQSVIPLADKDKFGNPKGSKFDLAKDGAFEGLQIAVLHLYTGEGFDFSYPSKALAEKGFAVHRWTNQPPPIQEFKEVLAKSCQLWIISDERKKLNADHLDEIRSFFELGRGVYIWGDNVPYYADANYVADALFGGNISGNLIGDKIVHADGLGQSGLKANHLICTGIENLYEGVTIATVRENSALDTIVFGSAGNIVVAAYDREGRRALLDGGFTRLFVKWDTAGTGRYVKNAAAWLVNYESGKSMSFR